MLLESILGGEPPREGLWIKVILGRLLNWLALVAAGSDDALAVAGLENLFLLEALAAKRLFKGLIPEVNFGKGT